MFYVVIYNLNCIHGLYDIEKAHAGQRFVQTEY